MGPSHLIQILGQALSIAPLNKSSESATTTSHASAGHRKVIEKTLPGQSLDCRGVLPIVTLGGAEGI